METKQLVRNFIREEDGQTTTEYVLILAVILTIIMQFKKKLFAIVTKLFNTLDEKTPGITDDF